jgi:hypothetical protein
MNDRTSKILICGSPIFFFQGYNVIIIFYKNVRDVPKSQPERVNFDETSGFDSIVSEI